MVCSWGRVIRFIEAAFDLGLWIVARVSFAYRCEITRWELENSEPCISPLCNYLHPLRRETSSLDVIFVTISRFVAQQEQWKSISIRTIISELNSWILLLLQLFRSHAFNVWCSCRNDIMQFISWASVMESWEAERNIQHDKNPILIAFSCKYAKSYYLFSMFALNSLDIVSQPYTFSMFVVVDVYTVFHTVSNVKLLSTSMSNFTFFSPNSLVFPRNRKSNICVYILHKRLH